MRARAAWCAAARERIGPPPDEHQLEYAMAKKSRKRKSRKKSAANHGKRPNS
jgi:hypothetical protein